MSFTPKKSLGQNFLKDQKIIDSIVEIGDIRKDDVVIEVGPGFGALTEKILNKNPKNIIVIEKDEKLVKFLSRFVKRFFILRLSSQTPSSSILISDFSVITSDIAFSTSSREPIPPIDTKYILSLSLNASFNFVTSNTSIVSGNNLLIPSALLV